MTLKCGSQRVDVGLRRTGGQTRTYGGWMRRKVQMLAPGLGLALGLFLTALPSAHAQRSKTVYPDEGVGTRDALVRVRELSEAGNMPEALRVLQKTMEAEGEQLVQT